MADKQPIEKQQSRPHAHLTVDELRKAPGLTDAEWWDELEAHGIITPAVANAPPFSSLKVTLPPGAPERFIKGRG